MRFDANVPNPARMWNYWLGGKDNFAADRAAAEQIIDALPSMPQIARWARRFLVDAVCQLVTVYGVRQFLDIGSGLPTADNTHEVAQRLAPESRVVYVDNDPIVLAHARALLVSAQPGKTAYIGADLRDSSTILAKAAQTLDFGQPVALMFLMTLQYIPDADDPHAIVRTYMDACAPGSFLVVADTTNEASGPALAEGTRRMNQGMGGAVTQTRRPAAQVGRYFEGLQLVEPGLISTHRWRPGPDEPDTENDWPVRCGIGRKP